MRKHSDGVRVQCFTRSSKKRHCRARRNVRCVQPECCSKSDRRRIFTVCVEQGKRVNGSDMYNEGDDDKIAAGTQFHQYQGAQPSI